MEKGVAMQPDKVEILVKDSAEAVNVLLGQYSVYLELEKILNTGIDHRKKAEKAEKKFSFQGGQSQYLGPGAKLTPEARVVVELEKKTLGEAMKFQSPLIWLEYKRRAYANDPKNALLTLGDLIKHTSVDGICHRRFDAINLYFRRKYGGKDMRSSSFIDPTMSLVDVGQDTRFIDMCLDQEFMSLWSRHENGASGKWKEYVLTSPDHDCEINCTC